MIELPGQTRKKCSKLKQFVKKMYEPFCNKRNYISFVGIEVSRYDLFWCAVVCKDDSFFLARIFENILCELMNDPTECYVANFIEMYMMGQWRC